MNTTAEMAAFGASDAACYKWPEDTAEAKACRAAYCDGAAWAADEIERMRADDSTLRSKLWMALDNEDIIAVDEIKSILQQKGRKK